MIEIVFILLVLLSGISIGILIGAVLGVNAYDKKVSKYLELNK